MKNTKLSKILHKAIMEQQEVDELLKHGDYQNDPKLQILRDAINSNKTVSVAFVKKDKTVRHMAVRKSLKAYVASTAPKTDRQQNVEANNDIVHVIDINAFIKLKKETGDEQAAAKGAWRNINLKTVLGFMASGKFIDMRQENEIMKNFGEEIYNSLTKSMAQAMNAEMQQLDSHTEAPEQEAPREPQPVQENKKRVIRITESQVKKIMESIDKHKGGAK